METVALSESELIEVQVFYWEPEDEITPEPEPMHSARFNVPRSLMKSNTLSYEKWLAADTAARERSHQEMKALFKRVADYLHFEKRIHSIIS